jgi:putative membrane protein
MKSTSHGRINFEILLKVFILLSFSFCFMATYTSGNIRNYLNPRLFPYVFFAGLAFLLMAVNLLFSLFKHKTHKLNPIPYLLFLIPLILTLALPAQALTVDSTHLSSMQIVGLPAKADPNLISNDWGSFKITNGTIILTDKNYMACYQELMNHPVQYKGRTVEFIGYVSKSESGLQKNEFIVGRDLMWCCAAELQLVGFLCSNNSSGSLPENSWVKVDGMLDVTTWQGKSTPIFVNPVMTQISKPAVEYIYPFQ